MSAIVKVPAILNDSDIVASVDGDILSLYWNKATGELRGKKGSSGEVLTFNSIGIKQVSISIPSAEVLDLFATPKVLVAAPGAGFAIVVIEVSTELVFNSSAYATNTQLNIITDTADKQQLQNATLLLSTASRITKGLFIAPSGATDTQIIEDKALTVAVETGDPTAGDSNITVNLTYRLISV